MWYRAGADLVVIVHLLFIGFVVGGVFLAWRWPRIVWAHIPAVVYGALVELLHLPAHAAGERPAPPCRRGRVPRRVHRALPGQGDPSGRAHPCDASRAGRPRAPGRGRRGLGAPPPACPPPGAARALARGRPPAPRTRPG